MVVTNATFQNLARATNDIRDIRPPVEIPNPWAWVWWILGALAVAGLLLAVLIYFLTRRNRVPMPPPIPAHVRARQKLQEALAIIARPEPFCVLVSNTIRHYLEERFTFRAPERTTEEFLHELRETDLLTTGQKDRLGEFLQRCDLVKFARYEPGDSELRDLHASALRLVEETEPLPESAPGDGQSPIDDTEVATTSGFEIEKRKL
jgi:Domain of unknown function (DUF4381)